jgi:general secretion pathway protein D
MVTFSPPNTMAKVGDSFKVNVMINQATRVGSIPFHVAYDPKILQFVSSSEGGFLKSDGASTIFNAQASTLSEVFVALARIGVPAGVAGGGVLCTLEFKAIAAGSSSLTFTEASVLDPQGQPLPAQFSPGAIVGVQQN